MKKYRKGLFSHLSLKFLDHHLRTGTELALWIDELGSPGKIQELS